MSYKRGELHPTRGDKMTAVEWNEFAKKNGWDGLMEDWEAKLRDKLEVELEEGGYQVGGPGFWVHTGKGGKIEVEVAIAKALKEIKL